MSTHSFKTRPIDPYACLCGITVLMLISVCFGCKRSQPVSAVALAHKVPDTLDFRLFTDAVTGCRFQDALQYGERYYKAALVQNDSSAVFRGLAGMADLYLRKGDYEASFSFARELYDISARTGNSEWIKIACGSLGSLNAAVDRAPEALSYFRRAQFTPSSPDLPNAEPAKSDFLFHLAVAETFSLLGETDSAMLYYRFCQARVDSGHTAVLAASLGELEFRQGRFTAALAGFRKAEVMSRSRSDLYSLMRSLIGICNSSIALGHPEAALVPGREAATLSLRAGVTRLLMESYQSLFKAYDRLGFQDSANAGFRRYATVKELVLGQQTKTRLDMFGYENQIARLHSENSLAELQNEKTRLTRNVLMAGSLLMLLFLLVLYRTNRIKSEQQIQQRRLVESELVVSRTESARVAADLQRQKTILEMQALRARMNPHFIFNCLNSINQFILNNDSRQAADYLTKFARLMRVVLEKSAMEFISLEDEIESVRLYMDLERLRFEHPFQYTITCHEFDPALIEVPSLFLQPFVENAIWHGLNPARKKEGKIDIDFGLSDNMLYCSIADNGIGINQSMISKESRNFARPSFGIDITRKRLELAQAAGGSPEIVMTETRDGEGAVSGTSVRILIPVKPV